MAKHAKKSKKQQADYKNRWPTQQTLVESWIKDHPSKDPERRRSMRAKALETVSLPLLWMNMKLEQWQENIEHRVELLEAQRQKRYSVSSALENHHTQTRRAPGTKSTSPGKSKHPYDTGVGRLTETEPAIPEESSASPSHAKPRETAPKERVKRPNLMPRNPKPKPTPEPRPGSADITAGKDAVTQVIPGSRKRGSFRDTGKIKICSTGLLKGQHPQAAKSAISEPVERSAGAGKNTESRQWWWPFPKRQNMSEGDLVEDSSDLDESDTTEDETEDVAALVKPRGMWKSVRGRCRSGFTPSNPTISRSESDSARGIRKRAQKNAALERLDNKPGGTMSKPSELKADTHMQPEAQEAIAGYLSVKSGRGSHETSRASPKQTRKGTPSSTLGRPSTAGSHGGRSSTPAPTDVALDSPKAPSQYMRLLVGNRRTPPSRTVSPLDINGSTAANSGLTLPAGRPSMEGRTSGRNSADQKNKSWLPSWAWPKAQADSPPPQGP